MRVVCIKYGTKYGADYVLKLQSMVARHLKRDHHFICLTDKPVEGINCQPLPCDLPSWWSKLGLFRFPAEETLYLDLDVVVSAAIELPPLNGKLWALDDFSYSLVRNKQDVDPWTRRQLGGAGTINSSVMYWRGSVGQKVWDDFTPGVMTELHGDQNWITRCLWPNNISLFPEGLACSFKYHIERGAKPAPITVFHGNPKPHDIRSSFVREHWC